MPDERRFALRQVRGDMSFRAFAEHLVTHGLAPGRLSRHRLARVERGEIELPAGLWDEIADALIRAGRTATEIAGLRPTTRPIEPPPLSTPGQRLDQWRRVVVHVRNNRWWRSPITLIARVTSPENLPRYRQIIARYGVDRMRYLRDVRTRLDRGAATAGQWRADPADGIAVDHARSVLAADLGRVELFLFRLYLHNVGQAPWRDRLLYRIGPPVTSGTPFTPGVLPVPDTEPGQSCEILIPGRTQWLYGCATVSYVMVFPDFTPCLPGRIRCWIDTRSAGTEHSLPLPPGFPSADASTTNSPL
jgi:hypothetical protein